MFIYKKLKASDVGITAFEAHKEFNVTSSNTASLGVTLFDSSFSSASRDTFSLKINDLNNHKRYFQLDRTFYDDALFNYGNLLGGLNYNQQEKRLYDKATIISLSQKTFGNGVQKGTIDFNNNYIDDSKGNLYSKNIILNDYPKDKERIFYLGPVKGFRYYDLSRDYRTGEIIVNHPSTLNGTKLDDSLYTNVIEYISCSFSENTLLNSSLITLNQGYIKAPHNKSYNFGSEDFTITFWYKPTTTTVPKFIIGKSTTKTIVETPESSVNGDLKSTRGSANFLQPKEVDAGKAFPFEVIMNSDRKIEFSRADQDNNSNVIYSSTLTNNTLAHIAVRKSGNELKIFVNGNSGSNSGVDSTDLCKNEADLFIGSQGGSRESISFNKEHDISQIMIFNKALSHKEIKNVSSSITGTPYVGNVFYENGLVTLTSPIVNDGTLTTLSTFNDPITLDITPFANLGDQTNIFNDIATFSGSTVTFTSSRENFDGNYNSTLSPGGGDNGGETFFSNLEFNSTYVSASLDFISNNGRIKLKSRETASITSVLIQNFVSESLEPNITDTSITTAFGNLTSSVVAVDDLLNNHQQDSLTEIGFYLTDTSKTCAFLTENKTLTQSFEITPIDSSSIFAEDFTVQDDSLNHVGNTFSNTKFELANDLDGFTEAFIDEDMLGTLSRFTAVQTRAFSTSDSPGEIVCTGSRGYTSVFTNDLGNNSSPKVEIDGSVHGVEGAGFIRPAGGGITNDAELSLDPDYAGNNWVDSTLSNLVINGTPTTAGVDVPTSFYSDGNPDLANIADFSQVDALKASSGKFRFGPAIGNTSDGTSTNFTQNFFNRYYYRPGNLRFRCTFNAKLAPNFGGCTVTLARRILRGNSVLRDWFEFSGGVALNTTENFYELEGTLSPSIYQTDGGYLNDGSSYADSSVRVQWKLIFTKTSGATTMPLVRCTSFTTPKVFCFEQTEKPGFKSRVAIRSKDDQITAQVNDLLRLRVNGISLDENDSTLMNFPGLNSSVTSGSYHNAFDIEQGQSAGIGNPDLRGLKLVCELRIQEHTNSAGADRPDALIEQFLISPPTNSPGDFDADIDFHHLNSNFIGLSDFDTEKFYVRFYLGVPGRESSGVLNEGFYYPAMTHAPEGFSIRSVFVDRYRPVTTYDTDQTLVISGSSQTDDLVANNSTAITFNDNTFIQVGTIPVSFTQVSGDDITFEDAILITSSLGATASMDIGAQIEATSSFTGLSRGLYEVRNVTVGTNPTLQQGQFIPGVAHEIPGLNPNNMTDQHKLAVQTFKNGTLVDTKLVTTDTISSNVFDPNQDNALPLGILDTTDNIKFVFRTVSASSTINANPSIDDTVSGSVFKHTGFNIFNITMTKLTGSNTVRRIDGGTFDPEVVGNKIQISSSHTDIGNVSFPFSTGQFTSSILSISENNQILTIEGSGSSNELIFITSSLSDAAHTANIFESGPFIISASYTVRDSSNNSERTLPNSKLYQHTTAIINITNDNDPGTNVGFGFKATAQSTAGDSELEIVNSFKDIASNDLITDVETEFRLSSPSKIKYDFFVSGASSELFPNGVVTASNLDYEQFFAPITLTLSAISGSNLSNGPTFSAEEFSPYGFPSTKLRITSSHDTTPSETPLFTLGKSEQDIVSLENSYIKVSDILFITGASNITGSSQSQSLSPLGFSFDSQNPISADGVTDEMLGGIFEFDDLSTTNTDLSAYRIIDITPDPNNENSSLITLDNQGGGADAIQTINDSDFTNASGRNVTVKYQKVTANDFKLNFKNNHLIFENEYHCTVDEDEYNFTLNPSVRKNKSISDGELANFATGSSFRPYVTTIGLYNDDGELLVVGKLGQPVKMSQETDTTFVVRYDT